MAKITKRMLKGIVKECLVEILSEGLGETDVISEKRNRTKQPSKKKSLFDQMDEAFERKPSASDHITFDTKVNQAASAATSDPVLQSILADTARTTLQEQMGHERQMPTTSQNLESPLSPAVGGGSAGIDISTLFGEATKNWSEVLERTTPGPL
tara:strand:- start:3073 stop:3534 length:462 start_codon:yes stop_codon:yes gene_type:complete